MTKWKSGDTPCWMCEKDWYDEDEENIDEHYIGTYTYPECGDGCCWNRAVCEECGGTGKEVGK